MTKHLESNWKEERFVSEVSALWLWTCGRHHLIVESMWCRLYIMELEGRRPGSHVPFWMHTRMIWLLPTNLYLFKVPSVLTETRPSPEHSMQSFVRNLTKAQTLPIGGFSVFLLPCSYHNPLPILHHQVWALIPFCRMECPYVRIEKEKQFHF